MALSTFHALASATRFFHSPAMHAYALDGVRSEDVSCFFNPHSEERHMTPHHIFRAVLTGVAIACIGFAATAQTWEYKGYKKNRTGSIHKEEIHPGNVS